MTPTASTSTNSELGLEWHEGWEAEPSGRKSSKEDRGDHPVDTHDIWDRLKAIDKVREKRRAEDIISNMEEMLSKLSSGDDSPARGEDTENDIFSSHHMKVIEKGAGENG